MRMRAHLLKIARILNEMLVQGERNTERLNKRLEQKL